MTTLCPKKPNLAEISPHLICALCGGYLIDATTIVECLHSFCKTCIVRYLESSKYCPICEVLVHKTRPLQNIRLDHTLQDIVYKLVPGLFKDEMRRRREYYKDSPTIRSPQSRQAQQRHRVIYSADEKFSVTLECSPDGRVRTRSSRRSRGSSREAPPDRRYLLCPASTTVALLKKFIRSKFAIPDKYKVDLFHTDGNLRDTYSLMDVAYIYSWKREGVLQLYYSVFKEPEPTPKIEITEVKEEVKLETIPKAEDNRPSSLFTKNALLNNRGMDGDIPHNLSPLELIATVANDVSCLQEGRGLKRKTLDIPLYENDEESSNEIQIQKSIEHAIDLCSTGAGNSVKEIPQMAQATTNTKEVKDSSSETETSQSIPSTNVLSSIKPISSGIITPNKQGNIVTRVKPKEKPKTTDAASQCDPKRKKHKGEVHNTTSAHSKPASKPVKQVTKDGVNNITDKTQVTEDMTNSKSDKPKQKEEVNVPKHDKTKQKDEVTILKSDKMKVKEELVISKVDLVKANGNNNNIIDHNNAAVKTKDLIKAEELVKRDNLAPNQHTQSITRDASTGKVFTNLKTPIQNESNTEKTIVSGALTNQKAALKSQNETQRKTEVTSLSAQINGHGNSVDVVKQLSVVQRTNQSDA